MPNTGVLWFTANGLAYEGADFIETFLKSSLQYAFSCGAWIIPRSLDPYNICWCPDSLRRMKATPITFLYETYL